MTCHVFASTPIIGLLIRYEVATNVSAHEYLIMYFWLHGGYMESLRKDSATKYVALFLYLAAY